MIQREASCALDLPPASRKVHVQERPCLPAVQMQYLGHREGNDTEWHDASERTDESWYRAMDSCGFRGYPEREGIERWPGF